MSDERRRARRIAYFAEARLQGHDVGQQLVRVADISTTGAFVDARASWPAGSKTNMSFTVLGREITVLIEVRYSMPPFGMGVRFLNLSDEDRQLIEELVASQG